jgi:hypothetical protein
MIPSCGGRRTKTGSQSSPPLRACGLDASRPLYRRNARSQRAATSSQLVAALLPRRSFETWSLSLKTTNKRNVHRLTLDFHQQSRINPTKHAYLLSNADSVNPSKTTTALPTTYMATVADHNLAAPQLAGLVRAAHGQPPCRSRRASARRPRSCRSRPAAASISPLLSSPASFVALSLRVRVGAFLRHKLSSSDHITFFVCNTVLK